MLAQVSSLPCRLQLVELDTSLDQVLLLHSTHGIGLLMIEGVWSVEATRALLALVVCYNLLLLLLSYLYVNLGGMLLIVDGDATTYRYAACLGLLLLSLGQSFFVLLFALAGFKVCINLFGSLKRLFVMVELLNIAHFASI
jgi:hypothetical protein